MKILCVADTLYTAIVLQNLNAAAQMLLKSMYL